MYKLVALYNQPASKEAFSRHLVDVHLPLVAAFPGLRKMTYGLDLENGGGEVQYFAVVECYFDDLASLQRAMLSPEAKRASADVPNYAAAGFTINTFEISEFDLGRQP